MKHLIFVLVLLAYTPVEGADKAAAKGTKAVTKAAAKEDGRANKKTTFRKTQEVNFDGSNVDGQVRSPDGAYLLQKRGVQFMPLYKVNNQFEKNILESVEYLR